MKHVDGLLKSGNVEDPKFIAAMEPDFYYARANVRHWPEICRGFTALNEFQLVTCVGSDVRLGGAQSGASCRPAKRLALSSPQFDYTSLDMFVVGRADHFIGVAVTGIERKALRLKAQTKPVFGSIDSPNCIALVYEFPPFRPSAFQSRSSGGFSRVEGIGLACQRKVAD